MLIWRSLKPSSILACLSFFVLRREGESEQQAQDGDDGPALQRARIQEATDEIQSRL